MKISELRKKLKELKRAYGDLDVVCQSELCGEYVYTEYLLLAYKDKDEGPYFGISGDAVYHDKPEMVLVIE